MEAVNNCVWTIQSSTHVAVGLGIIWIQMGETVMVSTKLNTFYSISCGLYLSVLILDFITAYI